MMWRTQGLAGVSVVHVGHEPREHALACHLFELLNTKLKVVVAKQGRLDLCVCIRMYVSECRRVCV